MGGGCPHHKTPGTLDSCSRCLVLPVPPPLVLSWGPPTCLGFPGVEGSCVPSVHRRWWLQGTQGLGLKPGAWPVGGPEQPRGVEKAGGVAFCPEAPP